jgi:hypothetical protein
VAEFFFAKMGFPGAWFGPLVLGSYCRVWGGLGGDLDDGFHSISGNLEGIGVCSFIQPHSRGCIK